MTSPARRPDVVRLTKLDDLVAAVPHLLGFHPAESLVAIAMTGRRERLSFTMRVDLPSVEVEAEVVAMCVRAMTRARAEQVLLFVYTDAAHLDGNLPQTGLVEQIAAELPMPVRDALLVTDERVWSYVCGDPVCCPPEGRVRERDTPGAVALAAAHALQGHSVLPSRDALVASLTPTDNPATLEAAISRAAAAFGAAGESAVGVGAGRLLSEVVARYADPAAVSKVGAAMTADEAALLVVALHDVDFRDRVLLWCVDNTDDARSLFGDLARSALPPMDAPTCTLLAATAYLQGEGAVAGAALERARASDPGYALALLLDEALRGQISPADIRRALGGFGVSPSTCRRPAGRRRRHG